MYSYNPNYHCRHTLERQVRQSLVAVSEPEQGEEEEAIEYFDVDEEMKFYRLDAVSPLSHDRRGTYNTSAGKRLVIQRDLNGKYIDTYPTVSAAARAANADPSSIRRCINSDKKYGQVAGYKWAFAEVGEAQNQGPVI